MALILVIDDAAAMRELVRRMLVRAEHTVIEAEDGEIGVSVFRDKRPALVITDLLMPNKEGIETIQDIRRISSATPIIAMSGSTATNGNLYLGAAKKLGADAVLSKPFKPDELLRVVDRLLSGA